MGASSFDPNFRGFHWPVTAPRPHFTFLQFSVKIKYPGNLKYDFSKIVYPRVYSNEISEIRPSGR